ncbi:30S ribosomal protein S15 [Clostridium sp. CAG:1219]|nr:30S ribosomal protein S15 [Clostridium sp. CAG:1219]
MTKERKSEILKEFARTEGDTGSVEVQVALLTERINEVTDHLRIHKHDEHSRRGLFMMVGKRKKLLRYLESEDIERYRALISKLNIRK